VRAKDSCDSRESFKDNSEFSLKKDALARKVPTFESISIDKRYKSQQRGAKDFYSFSKKIGALNVTVFNPRERHSSRMSRVSGTNVSY